MSLLTTHWVGGSGFILPALDLGPSSVRDNEYLLLGILQRGAFSQDTEQPLCSPITLLLDIVSQCEIHSCLGLERQEPLTGSVSKVLA